MSDFGTRLRMAMAYAENKAPECAGLSERANGKVR